MPGFESSVATLLNAVALGIALGLDASRSGTRGLTLTASGSSSSGRGTTSESGGRDSTTTTHHGSGALQSSRALEGVRVHEHRSVVAGHHVGPVAGVVAPGAGHTRGRGRHGTGGSRTVLEIGAWSGGVVVVGRHAIVATSHVVAVHGSRGRAHGAGGGGRGHVSTTGLLAKDATVRRGAVRRSHDGRRGGLGLLSLLSLLLLGVVVGTLLLGEEALAVGRTGGSRGGATDGLSRAVVVEKKRRTSLGVARGRAAILDTLALDADDGTLVGLAVELGNGNLGHVRLSILDKGHSANVVGEAAGGVHVGRALDHIDLEDVAGCAKHHLKVLLLGGWGQIADKDGAAVALAVGEEGLVAVAANGSTVLLQVEGGDAVGRVIAERLEHNELAK